MKTFQLAALVAVVLAFTSCASPEGVKKNSWGYNNNPDRPQVEEVAVQEEEVTIRTNNTTQRVNNDMWQNPLVISGYDTPYYSSMMFNAPPRFVPVMVPWWESSRYWHYNSSRHFMFQCDPMLVYWDWYSPYYNTNPFWGGAFVPTRYAWGGFTTYHPPVTRTIVEPNRSQQVRDFGPNRGTTSNPNSIRQPAPTNDGWNTRSQNYRPAGNTTTSPNSNTQRNTNDGWNSRTTTPTSTTKTTVTPRATETTNPSSTNSRHTTAPRTNVETTSPSRGTTTSPSRSTTTSPSRSTTTSPSRSTTTSPSRSTTTSPSRSTTSSPSRSTETKSAPSSSSKRSGR
jgi:hypothetical protein